MQPFTYPDPIQGGEEKVTRQVGIDPQQQDVASDPMPDRPIVQGSPEIHTVRNPGNGAGRMGPSNTFYADHVVNDDTMYADTPAIPFGSANPPPTPRVADAPRDSFDAPGNPAPTDVVASDKPAPGQPVEGAPQVITPEQVAAAKAVKKGKG